MIERLQKVLARAGYGSRREIEGWIEAGRVTVNGAPAQLGQGVQVGDVVAIDGRAVAQRQLAPVERRVIAYHKPVGEMCTRADPEGRATVFDKLPRPRTGRWVAVGRLDINTCGLLLLTTDGDLANRLMHPSAEVEREYAVRVLGVVDPAAIERMCCGVALEDGPAHFDRVMAAGGTGANQWFHVILSEGRKREVRRLWESQGLTVSRLIRVRYGPVALRRGLRAGQWEDVEGDALRQLLQIAGLEAPPPPEPERKPSGARPRATTSRQRNESSRPGKDSVRAGKEPSRPLKGAVRAGKDATRSRNDATKPGQAPARPGKASARQGKEPARPGKPGPRKPAPRRPAPRA